MAFRSILVVDDDAGVRHMLTLALGDHGYEVRAAGGGDAALQEIAARPYEVMICDVRMPKMDGLTLLRRALEAAPEMTVVVMTAYGTHELALEAMKAGAYDYISKPFKPDEIVLVLKKAEERERLKRENVRLRAQLARNFGGGNLIGSAEVMGAVERQIEKVAAVKATVLILGESGTGKELVARALHDRSPRASMPFVPVNCGAIPADLMESELFGHVRGAFTDARRDKDGLFLEADGGTLFLDEVGELPGPLQVKLLRALQEEEVRRVGDTKSQRVDVRVVAATARDLARAVTRGEFREDLYYRLNVLQIALPPLRDRREDIPALAAHFVAKYNERLNRSPPVRGFTPEALALLCEYGWPGNVRELENAVERALVLCDGDSVGPDALPDPLLARPRRAAAVPVLGDQDLSIKRASRAIEDELIRRALRRTRGNRTRAAELLELSHRALLYKIKEYGIDPDREGALGEDGSEGPKTAGPSEH